MNISRIIYRLKLINLEIEFLSIFIWTLFFPDKNSKFYFLIFAILIIIFSIRNIYYLKNFTLTVLSYFIIAFNVIFIFTTFFSVYHFKSILLLSDIILISFYFILISFDQKNEEKLFRLIAYPITLFSLLNIIDYVFSFTGGEHLFFLNPILQGIVSGIGVLITFYFLLKKTNWILIPLLIINTTGVFISGSKSAFIGIMIFSLLLSLYKNKKRTLFIIIFIILTFIIPNPIKNMFHYSLKKDPYAFDRINIWKMSVNIFADHFFTGIGLENFSEGSKQHNFKQEKGPANYFKIPRQPHSDFFKIIVETGILGLIMLLIFLFFILKRIFSPPRFNLSKILLLYFLFQALFFNITFQIFFFFSLLFLLKSLFNQTPTFKSFSLNLKLLYTFFLIFIFIVSYLLPYLSVTFIKKSKKAINFIQSFNLLKKAEYITPLDKDIHYLISLHHFEFFKKTSNIESFHTALNSIRKIQKLNKFFIDSYMLEADLYIELLRKKLKYVSLDEEIIHPLSKAEVYHPFNPFIKLKKAHIYYEFNKKELARREALKALEVEPEFISALYFLQKNFNYFPDHETYNAKINEIQKKTKRINPKPGTYLYDLYRVPAY